MKVEDIKIKVENTMLKRYNAKHALQVEKFKEKVSGENSGRWKGGNYDYFHKKARKLFEKDNCQKCGISIVEHIKTVGRKFDMHCISKNYDIMEHNNWLCLC